MTENNNNHLVIMSPLLSNKINILELSKLYGEIERVLSGTLGTAGAYSVLKNSHVLPALIRKFHLAKLAQQGAFSAIAQDEAIHGKIPEDMKAILQRGGSEVTVWGSGTPRREFLYVDDMADACVFLMNLSEKDFNLALNFKMAMSPLINIGVGKDITIKEMSEQVKKIVGFQGDIVFDDKYSDGTPRKLMDIDRLSSFGWRAKTSLVAGLEKTYADYLRSIKK